MEVVPFAPEHLFQLDPGPFDRKHIEPLKGAPLTGSSFLHPAANPTTSKEAMSKAIGGACQF
ncbi:MAG: hypothetical protein IIB54_04925 [Planctomycetes bacterium]|nr:hypothetical protein [Planctomycetota bacterium]